MAIRPNSESRLISALVNTGDVERAIRLGIAPEMFATYTTEYRWLLSFPGTYGHQPSPESLRTKFPEFPYSDSYTDVGFICGEVRAASDHRLMVRAIENASRALHGGDTEEAYGIISSLSIPGQSLSYELRNDLHDMSLLDHYDEPLNTQRVPWKALQDVTGGIAIGDLWYLAARLGQGKSWSLAAFARDALMDGANVLYVSLEMPKPKVLQRLHVCLAPEVGFTDVRHSDLKGRSFDPILYRKLMQSIISEVPGTLSVVDRSKGGVSTANVQAMSRGMDLVIIDYAGLLMSPLGGRAVEDWRTMAAISNILKEIAVSNDTRIIAAAQINREGDKEGWRPPKVKNLAQSDALGQDADVVVTHKQRSKTVMVYSCEKNRDGEGGALWHTRFRPNEGRFDQISLETALEAVDADEDAEAGR